MFFGTYILVLEVLRDMLSRQCLSGECQLWRGTMRLVSSDLRIGYAQQRANALTLCCLTLQPISFYYSGWNCVCSQGYVRRDSTCWNGLPRARSRLLHDQAYPNETLDHLLASLPICLVRTRVFSIELFTSFEDLFSEKIDSFGRCDFIYWMFGVLHF